MSIQLGAGATACVPDKDNTIHHSNPWPAPVPQPLLPGMPFLPATTDSQDPCWPLCPPPTKPNHGRAGQAKVQQEGTQQGGTGVSSHMGSLAQPHPGPAGEAEVQQEGARLVGVGVEADPQAGDGGGGIPIQLCKQRQAPGEAM